jgi:hypothetical protein
MLSIIAKALARDAELRRRAAERKAKRRELAEWQAAERAKAKARVEAPAKARAELHARIDALGLDADVTAAFKAIDEGEARRVIAAAGNDLAVVVPVYLAIGDKHARRDAWDAFERLGLPFRAAIETFYLTRALQ